MRLLIIRTSAMGDVAMTAPVLTGMREQYPDVQLVLLTRAAYKPFFASIKGLDFLFPDFKKRHKGFLGLFRLFMDLRRQGKIDMVIDLHDVTRSKVLRFFFKVSGVPSSIIDKGRKEKRAVRRGEIKTPLKHSVERYYDVFANAGFPVKATEGPWITPSSEALLKAGSILKSNKELLIGVAPYAIHKLKMWPAENMYTLLRMISEKYKAKFFLFGGKDEAGKLDLFQILVPDAVNMAGKLNLDEELALISKLDLMIAMDSSNMHMAALVGTPVISIWGGTDPLNGFSAWMQPENYSIRIPIEELKCRPCTIYGKGECKRGDTACMNWQTPELVFKKISESGVLMHS